MWEGGPAWALGNSFSDVGVGMIGGYVGTQLMERVSMKLYELESEEDREREEAVRPGPPFYAAAKKTAEALGIELSEEQLQKVATYGFHYGLGMGWGPTYAFLRR
jgi:glutamate synthase domain-containing protein 3